MSKLNIVSIILMFIILFCVPQAALAEGLQGPLKGDQVIFGGDFELEAGETMNGTLVALGGDIYIHESAILNGDLINVGGQVRIYGMVNGDMVVIGGTVFLSDTAVVQGDSITPGGSVEMESGAKIYGDRIGDFSSFDFSQFDNPQYFVGPQTNYFTNQVTSIFWFIFRSFALAAVAVVAMVFIPKRIDHISDVMVKNPLASGGIGLAVIMVGVPLIVILVITIIMCLVGFGLMVVLFLAWVAGMIAIGNEIGKRLKEAITLDMTDALWTGLGVLILSLIVGSVGMIACIGWTLGFVVNCVGIGAVTLSLFTMRTSSVEVVEVPPVD